jgi:DNA integrity scanning protein DisA with diadenylate cyclase activity
MNARHRVIDLVIQIENGDDSVKGQWAQAELDLSHIHSEFVEAVRFVAKLAGCDGAIVLSDDLRLLGFGAELRADLKLGTKIKDIKNEMRRTYKPLDIEEFGQRHRSAIKLVSRRKNFTVLVISQDGPITVVWSDSAKSVSVRKGAHFVNMNMPFA